MGCPERTCSVCRTKAVKGEFVRVVKEPNGQISIDETYKKNGRGMYICKTKDCIAKAIKTKAVSRSFKKDVGLEIYEKLGNLL